MANKEIISQWVDALRSGKYEQGRGALRTADGRWCCLGVLCDVVRKRWKKKLWHGAYWHDGEGGVLPRDVLRAAGLVHVNPDVALSDGGRCYLSGFNDDGFHFTEIADAIEREWLT